MLNDLLKNSLLQKAQLSIFTELFAGAALQCMTITRSKSLLSTEHYPIYVPSVSELVKLTLNATMLNRIIQTMVSLPTNWVHHSFIDCRTCAECLARDVSTPTHLK